MKGKITAVFAQEFGKGRMYLTPDGKRFFERTFGVSIFSVSDEPFMSVALNRFPLINIFKLDDFLTEKFPEHDGKLSMKEIIEKEFGEQAVAFVEYWARAEKK